MVPGIEASEFGSRRFAYSDSPDFGLSGGSEAISKNMVGSGIARFCVYQSR